MDEFEHVHRAASVVEGQWFAEPTDAAHGTGAHLSVPADIVAATRPECEKLRYTSDETCVGRESSSGREVSSLAGRYHPLYYAIVGTPSLWLDGTAAIYAMRVVTIALCSALLWLAAGAARSMGRPWMGVALALALAPTVAYSSIVVAPNALEIMASILLWVSLLAVFRAPQQASNAMLGRVAVGGAVLVTLRSLGPLWGVLILLTVLALTPQAWSRLRTVLRSRSGAITVLAVALVAVAGSAWTLLSSSWEISNADERVATFSSSDKATAIGKLLPLWVLQSVGAFPYRNNPAHPLVYACFFVVVLLLLLLAVIRTSGRLRISIVATAALALLVPAAISWTTFEQFGDSWQGRYTLPYSVGLVLLCGLIDPGRVPPWVRRRSVAVVLALVYALGHTAGPVAVQLSELRISPGVENGSWILLPPVLVGLLCALGSVLIWAGGWQMTRAASPAPVSRGPSGGSPTRPDASQAGSDRQATAERAAPAAAGTPTGH